MICYCCREKILFPDRGRKKMVLQSERTAVAHSVKLKPIKQFLLTSTKQQTKRAIDI